MPPATQISISRTIFILPPELIRLVFQAVLANFPEYSKILKFERYFQDDSFDLHRNYLSTPDKAQTYLLNAILVCRTWQVLGTEILYARTFLLTHRALSLFAKTVTMNSALAAYVRHVFILDHGEVPACEPTKDAPQLVHHFELRRVCRFGRTDLMRALRECMALESLMVTNRWRHYASILPIDNLFLEVSNIQNRLRGLTLYGCMSPDNFHYRPVLTPNVALPVLETLCLRDVVFSSGFQLPFLPSVRTLQLMQCTFFPRRSTKPETFVVPLETIPSLHTLELYNISFVPTLSAAIPSHSPHSSKVALSQASIQPDAGPSGGGPESNLRHFVVGVVSLLSFGTMVTDSMFPETLDTLTFVVSLGNNKRSNGLLLSLLACLQRNFGRPQSLKSFIIKAEAPPSGASLVRLDALSEIKAFCDVQSIVFSFCRIDIDSWVTQKVQKHHL